MFLPFIFIIALLVPSLCDQPSLEGFSSVLLEKFEQQSRADLVEEEFSNLRKNIRVRSEYPHEALVAARTRLERLFEDRVNALKKLTSAAESAAREYIHDTPIGEFNVPLDEQSCESEMARINDSDVRLVNNRARDTSGVHVNIESYRCDPKVRRDFGWTGSSIVEKTMKESKKEDATMGHQFIGTYSGLTRMYPRRRWEVEPAQITIDLFAPTFRPWFVNAEATPKDIVFLLDYSGSVKGPTMHLIKLTIMHILSTLSPNDHFFGVYFNSGYGPILSCHNNTFLPATTVNKKIFFEKLGEIEEKDQAHLSTPLKFSFDVLRDNLESNLTLFSNSRSGGHKLVMLFTDGVDEWPHAPLEEELMIRGSDPIRIFGFSMGYGSGQLPLLHWMACNTFATYSVVDSIMDVKPQSRVFLDMLSGQRAKEIAGEPIAQRNVSWTNLYMEAQGLGPTVTISMPVLHHRNNDVWGSQGLAGVAGVDIALSELTSKLPSGEQIYGFIVDTNGILLYHPQLVLPKTEIHCIRRSACYDASQVRAKAGTGLRVQYGFSDQRVYRLVGLIDSIPTIDMFEVEGNSTTLHAVRRKVIDRTCDDEPIIDGDREFYCSNLQGSPFTVVLVNSAVRQSLIHSPEVETMTAVRNPMVTYFLSKRDICGWVLDSLPPQSRFDALGGLSECPDDLSITRAMVNAVTTWAESWPMHNPNSNASCDETKLPPGFDARYFVNSFVHSRAQIQTYYPTCTTPTMKALTAKFDEERLSKDTVADLQVTVRNGVVIAYRSIPDKYGNRLAVVGSQWRLDYVDSLFRNWTNGSEEWSARCRNKECLLVTRSGFVLASTSRRSPAHLAEFDPQLFASLDEHNLVTVSSLVDAQAECAAKRTAPWSSPAASPRSPFRSVLDAVTTIISKTFWFDIYYLLSSRVSAQPSMTGGICRFQRIKPVERCFLRHTKYRMTLNITRQIQLTDIKCSRFARVFPVPGTLLTMIETDRACVGYKPKVKYPVQPEKLEGCNKVHIFERLQISRINNYTTLDEDDTLDCLPQSSHTTSLGSNWMHVLVISITLRIL